ncbi:MAG: hypothetical protein JO339_28360, partial [Alphaproteobacteria bacterium]|nr:hypothetical protein [Alphaproteobacteria bacterium]
MRLGLLAGTALAFALPPWFAGEADAQANCGGLNASQCSQANQQYQALSQFAALPHTSAGVNALQADMST